MRATRANKLKVGDQFTIVELAKPATLLAIDYSSFLMRGRFRKGWVPFANLTTGAVSQLSGDVKVIKTKTGRAARKTAATAPLYATPINGWYSGTVRILACSL